MEDLPFACQTNDDSEREGGQSREEDELPHFEEKLDPFPEEEREKRKSFQEGPFPELSIRQMFGFDEEDCLEVLKSHPGRGGSDGDEGERKVELVYMNSC